MNFMYVIYIDGFYFFDFFYTSVGIPEVGDKN